MLDRTIPPIYKECSDEMCMFPSPVVGGHVGLVPVQYCLVLGHERPALSQPVYRGGSQLLQRREEIVRYGGDR